MEVENVTHIITACGMIDTSANLIKWLLIGIGADVGSMDIKYE